MNVTHDERKRSYSNRTNGWLATLAGAAVLVAVGFGVGLVAGTAYEEPELVAQHLAGQTTDVTLGPVSDDFEPAGSPDGDVAAAPPLAEPDAALEAPPLGAESLGDAVAPPAAVPAQRPVLKPAAAGSGFSIQVGAFGSEATARQLAGELSKRGYTAYVTSEGAGARFKVRVGPIAGRGEAERVAERLETEHRLPTWILASGK
jgi:septal ring-binding cell division protein DamX